MNTIKVYDGPSLLDGQRIIVLLTGLKNSSANTKTGDMLQTWILRYDIAPNEAVKTGEDSSICGNCPLRPIHYKSNGMKKPCYVKTFQAPRSTWKANKDLPVHDPHTVKQLIDGRRVRRGSYGDPSAVPISVWEMLDNGERPTGYTHQWKTGANLSAYVMASVHSSTERAQAKSKGYRTFRIISDVSEIETGEILCPASKEAGTRTTCEKCGLCNGSKENDKRKDVAIVAH
tara:strand:+ start:325 stop:1017 length:693 start_codon:yes stop_codon:yes gene_type:complete